MQQIQQFPKPSRIAGRSVRIANSNAERPGCLLCLMRMESFREFQTIPVAATSSERRPKTCVSACVSVMKADHKQNLRLVRLSFQKCLPGRPAYSSCPDEMRKMRQCGSDHDIHFLSYLISIKVNHGLWDMLCTDTSEWAAPDACITSQHIKSKTHYSSLWDCLKCADWSLVMHEVFSVCGRVE